MITYEFHSHWSSSQTMLSPPSLIPNMVSEQSDPSPVDIGFVAGKHRYCEEKSEQWLTNEPDLPMVAGIATAATSTSLKQQSGPSLNRLQEHQHCHWKALPMKAHRDFLPTNTRKQGLGNFSTISMIHTIRLFLLTLLFLVAIIWEKRKQ